MGKNKHALITGLFLIIFVAAVTSIIYWIGHFERERNVYVISTREAVAGLNPESTVFYRGIAVGKVLNIKFDPNDSGIILVPIEVDKNILFTKGVYATLRLKGVTGLTQIQLADTGKIIERLPANSRNKAHRIPLVPSMTDKLLDSGEQILAKADHLMVRLNAVLNDENVENIGDILGNLKNLSNKLIDLNKSLDKVLIGIPELNHDAQATLKHINNLTLELQTLSKELRVLSNKTGHFADKASNFADAGKDISEILVQKTLPKMNILLTDLQATSRQVRNTASLLERNPQSLLLGTKLSEPAPGEPDYEETK
ncbi:MAG: MlaD family protein [Methylococcaceae bacterium]|nr:MlaD family protein [Methylococcaceae bacterium]